MFRERFRTVPNHKRHRTHRRHDQLRLAARPPRGNVLAMAWVAYSRNARSETPWKISVRMSLTWPGRHPYTAAHGRGSRSPHGLASSSVRMSRRKLGLPTRDPGPRTKTRRSPALRRVLFFWRRSTGRSVVPCPRCAGRRRPSDSTQRDDNGVQGGPETACPDPQLFPDAFAG